MRGNPKRLAVCLSSMFLLAGCQGKETSSGPVGEDHLPSVSFSSVDVSGVSETTLRIGMECNYAPFNWTDDKKSGDNVKIANAGGYADGYDVQMSRLLSLALNKPVEIYKTVWDSLILDLQSNNLDLVIAGMTDTAEREESIDFSDEYYHSEVVLLTKAEIANRYTDQSLSEAQLKALIQNQIIVSQSGTVEDDIAKDWQESYGSVHASPLETYGLAAQDVANGSAFGLVVELPVAKGYVKNMEGLGYVRLDQSILGEKQAELGVSIGLRKGETGLKNALNATLSQISNDVRVSLMEACVERGSED